MDGHLVFPAILAVCGLTRGVNEDVPFPTASIVFPARSQGLYQGFAGDYQLKSIALDNRPGIVAIFRGADNHHGFILMVDKSEGDVMVFAPIGSARWGVKFKGWMSL